MSLVETLPFLFDDYGNLLGVIIKNPVDMLVMIGSDASEGGLGDTQGSETRYYRVRTTKLDGLSKFLLPTPILPQIFEQARLEGDLVEVLNHRTLQVARHLGVSSSVPRGDFLSFIGLDLKKSVLSDRAHVMGAIAAIDGQVTRSLEAGINGYAKLLEDGLLAGAVKLGIEGPVRGTSVIIQFNPRLKPGRRILDLARNFSGSVISSEDKTRYPKKIDLVALKDDLGSKGRLARLVPAHEKLMGALKRAFGFQEEVSRVFTEASRIDGLTGQVTGLLSGLEKLDLRKYGTIASALVMVSLSVLPALGHASENTPPVVDEESSGFGNFALHLALGAVSPAAEMLLTGAEWAGVLT